ncbi:hypothetical protein, partial [Bradyrhizobium uaiense]|uniref:hypothetical protein n=1 Tax=Bradyrhizobium uaiense TaxID=2594946 RepID=UPI0019D54566
MFAKQAERADKDGDKRPTLAFVFANFFMSLDLLQKFGRLGPDITLGPLGASAGLKAPVLALIDSLGGEGAVFREGFLECRVGGALEELAIGSSGKLGKGPAWSFSRIILSLRSEYKRRGTHCSA